MGIEFHVDLREGILPSRMCECTASVLREMLGLASVPEIRLRVLENGRECPAGNQEIRRDAISPLFLLSVPPEPETAAILAVEGTVHVEVCGTRTDLELALVAAVAIALALELKALVHDEWQVFGEAERAPEDLLKTLTRRGTGSEVREAAEEVMRDYLV
jgi:hypothetical protein